MMDLGLGFAYPLGLFTLLLLAVPLLLHLINQRQTRKVIIGYLGFIQAQKRLRVTQLLLSDLLLLIVRIVLIILVSFAISQLFLSERQRLEKEQVYVSSQWLISSNAAQIRQLFEAHKSAEIRTIDTEFSLLNSRLDRGANNLDSIPIVTDSLALLDYRFAQFQHSKPTHIYITDRSDEVSHPKNDWDNSIIWHVQSDQTNVDAGPQDAVSPSQRVGIIHVNERINDAKAMQQVFAAINHASQVLQVSIYSEEQVIDLSALQDLVTVNDILVVLDDRTRRIFSVLAASVKDNAVKTILTDSVSKAPLQPITLTLPHYPFSRVQFTISADGREGLQVIPWQSDEQDPTWWRWQSQGGEPLLIESLFANQRRLIFAGSFDDSESSILAAYDFPVILSALLADDVDSANNRRVNQPMLTSVRQPVSDAEQRVDLATHSSLGNAGKSAQRPLEHWLLYLIVLCWIVERSLAWRRGL